MNFVILKPMFLVHYSIPLIFAALLKRLPSAGGWLLQNSSIFAVNHMRKNWWKILAFLLLMYTSSYGFLVKVPSPPGVPLEQSIRNMFFHVPMWFAMMVLFTVSVIYAIKFLRKPTASNDFYSVEFARTGIVFGFLGLSTGAIWAKYQWGSPWSNDPKQIGAAIALLIYCAYFVLRGSLTNEDKRGRISAVYNIFAFCLLFPTLWILPRLSESLHPGGMGSEGNPALNGRDLAPSMKIVFWPAVLGWILLGVWISTLRLRLRLISEKQFNNE